MQSNKQGLPTEAQERKAELAGDKKPQLMKRMLLVSGSVSIKIAARKAGRPASQRVGSIEEQWEQETEEEGEDSGLLYEALHPSCSSTVPRWSADLYSHMWLTA